MMSLLILVVSIWLDPRDFVAKTIIVVHAILKYRETINRNIRCRIVSVQVVSGH
jgi:hypothetical protein